MVESFSKELINFRPLRHLLLLRLSALDIFNSLRLVITLFGHSLAESPGSYFDSFLKSTAKFFVPDFLVPEHENSGEVEYKNSIVHKYNNSCKSAKSLDRHQFGVYIGQESN